MKDPETSRKAKIEHFCDILHEKVDAFKFAMLYGSVEDEETIIHEIQEILKTYKIDKE